MNAVNFVIGLMALATGALAQIDVSLRDPAICRAPDGTYYLTGTTKINTLEPKHADFQNNDGIRLWQSKDLKAWQEIGLVWDFSKVPGKDYQHGNWQRHLRAVPGQPEMPWSHGATSPELHYFRDTFWITFAMNDEHVGLLKSTTGKAEGPYVEIGLIGHRLLGGDPSLFADTDGAVYFVWGQGYLARLNDELTALAEEPRSLQLAVAGYPHDETIVDASGERGAFVFRQDDKYHFVFSAWNRRDGAGHFDTFLCTATNVSGPYSKPQRLFADAGQTTVFRDAAGALHAVWSVNDTLTIRRLP